MMRGYSSVETFLAEYKSYPNDTQFVVTARLPDFLARVADMNAAAAYLDDHVRPFYPLFLNIFCTSDELAAATVSDLDNLVATADEDFIPQEFFVDGYTISTDAAHMRSILTNYFYFPLGGVITVTDTAAEIATLQNEFNYYNTPGVFLGTGPVVMTWKVADSSVALQALTPTAIRAVVDGGLTHVDATDDRLQLGMRQYLALGGVDFADEDRHVVRATRQDDHIEVAMGQWTRLHGRGGDDRLELDSGGGVLLGGRGRDSLVGGEGADEFVFTRLGHSAAGSDRADMIRNFGPGDVVHLSFLDGLDGRPAFQWIGETEFSSSAGEVRLVKDDDSIIVAVDADGDSAADMSVVFRGRPDLAAEDFLV